MGTVTILSSTTQNPITTIGERAGICWGSDTSNQSKNYKRGLDCINSGHGRALEFVNVEMVLDGYSARVIREWYTHIGGSPTRLQESTRYINCKDFKYVIPPSIKSNEDARNEYENLMRLISCSYDILIDIHGVPKEDAAMLLPLGMATKIVDKRNLRNLVDMSHQRLCTRAYWEFQELFMDVCKALSCVSDEWKYVVDNLFVPKCELLNYCPEKQGCGRMPGREGC